MVERLSDRERERAARIVALFSVLVHAWITNDFREASSAKSELNEAGVLIRFRRAAESEASHG